MSAYAGDTPLNDLLKTVEQRYNRAKTLQVVFREDYTKRGHARRTESGVLQLRKPGRMRWDYTSPKGKLAVCDGKTLWLYSPDENRVDKWPLKDSDDMRAPLAFLLGKLHFDKEFRNVQGKREGEDTRITAEPKTDSLPYSAVEFLVTSQGRIREVRVTQFDQSVMGYTFDQEKMDPKLDDKLFQFQAPKGAEIAESDK